MSEVAYANDFCYCVDSESAEPVMLLNTHIGFDEDLGYGINSSLFQQELMKLDTMGKNKITIVINSPGGSVIDGWGIYSTILKTKTKVDTYVGGIAASIAAVIFQAGRKRIMADYSILMYHNPFGTDNTEQIAKYKESLVKMVSSRTGIEENKFSEMMDRTSWLNATECKDLGMCDEIEDSGSLNLKRKVGGDPQNAWKEANAILNSIYTKKQDMKQVFNKLGLNQDANEESVLSAIEKIKNQLSETEAKVTESAETVKNLNAELEAAKANVTELQAKVDEVEKEKAEAVEAIAETEATAIVEEAFNLGKITEESKPNWIAKGKTDLEGVKNLLDGIPVSAKAAKIGEVKDQDKVVPYSMNLQMAKHQSQKN